MRSQQRRLRLSGIRLLIRTLTTASTPSVRQEPCSPLKDLNGNTLTLAASGITSSAGLNIPFVRDSQGRITQITGATGNIYQYAYDQNFNLSTAGDLIGQIAALTISTQGLPLAVMYGRGHR